MADGGEREGPIESSQEGGEAMDTGQGEEQLNAAEGEGRVIANFCDS